MKQRLLVAAVGVPLLIVVLVLLPPIATAILTAAIAGAAAWEPIDSSIAPCMMQVSFTMVLTLTSFAARIMIRYKMNVLLPEQTTVPTVSTPRIATPQICFSR